MNSESISRVDFPDGFIFGTASSAYQVMLFIFLNFQFLHDRFNRIAHEIICCSLKELWMKETRELAYGILSQGNQVRVQNYSIAI